MGPQGAADDCPHGPLFVGPDRGGVRRRDLGHHARAVAAEAWTSANRLGVSSPPRSGANPLVPSLSVMLFVSAWLSLSRSASPTARRSRAAYGGRYGRMGKSTAHGLTDSSISRRYTAACVLVRPCRGISLSGAYVARLSASSTGRPPRDTTRRSAVMRESACRPRWRRWGWCGPRRAPAPRSRRSRGAGRRS